MQALDSHELGHEIAPQRLQQGCFQAFNHGAFEKRIV